MSESTVAARLAGIEEELAAACRRAGRDPGEVRLVAVSKRQPLERVQAAYDAGQRIFGENFVQALEGRHEAFPPDVEWHMIGHIQSNKARRAAELATLVHTLDSPKLARALSKATAGRSEPQGVLVQIRLGGEATKAGVEPPEAEALLETIRDLPGLSVRGLMVIPPPDDQAPRWFAELRKLRDRLAESTGLPLSELSMGMSSDYVEAVREGATLVRVGTAIFGPRDT